MHKAIQAGHAVGPLHGVPIALKDLIELEGQITTGGFAHWRTRRSSVTATIARRMITAGMIVLGKTHTVEFAPGGWGTNQHMGTPWNPWMRRWRSDARRLQQRLGRSGGRGADGAVGDRHRHRRIGVAAGLLLRADRAEGHDRTHQHRGHHPRSAPASTRRAAQARWRARWWIARRCYICVARPRSARSEHPWHRACRSLADPRRAASAACALGRMPAAEREGVAADAARGL